MRSRSFCYGVSVLTTCFYSSGSASLCLRMTGRTDCMDAGSSSRSRPLMQLTTQVLLATRSAHFCLTWCHWLHSVWFRDGVAHGIQPVVREGVRHYGP